MSAKLKIYKPGPRFPYRVGTLVKGANCAGRKFVGEVIAIRGPWTVVLDEPGTSQLYVTPVSLIEGECSRAEVLAARRAGEKKGRRPAGAVSKASSAGALDKRGKRKHRGRDPRQLRLL